MSFESDVLKFVNKLEKNADKVHKEIGKKYFGRISYNTTVLEGRLISNWQYSIGTPQGFYYDISPLSLGSGKEQLKQASQRKAELFVEGTKIGDDLVMANFAPYAYEVEMALGGKAYQQPQGWVRVTAGTWKSIVREAVDGINK